MSVEKTFTCTSHLHPRPFLQWSGRCRAVVNRVSENRKSFFSSEHMGAERHAVWTNNSVLTALWTWSPSSHLMAEVKSLCPVIGWESVVRWISISGASVQLLRGKSRSSAGNAHGSFHLPFNNFHVVPICRSAFEETVLQIKKKKII